MDGVLDDEQGLCHPSFTLLSFLSNRDGDGLAPSSFAFLWFPTKEEGQLTGRVQTPTSMTMAADNNGDCQCRRKTTTATTATAAANANEDDMNLSSCNKGWTLFPSPIISKYLQLIFSVITKYATPLQT